MKIRTVSFVAALALFTSCGDPEDAGMVSAGLDAVWPGMPADGIVPSIPGFGTLPDSLAVGPDGSAAYELPLEVAGASRLSRRGAAKHYPAS
ncbi:MAG: hypothetical protein M3Y87_13955 [Myxococcota bacterium]|nr:hypothetical protein [Myxococcota bacterium]